MTPIRDIIFRCRYSQEFKETFSYRLANGDRMGSIIGYSRDNAAVVYVLWDGRKSIDSLSISYVDILEEPVETKPVNLDMKITGLDKLKLLQEEAKKRHSTPPDTIIKVEEPKPPKEKKIIVKPVRAKKEAAPKEIKTKINNVDFEKVNQFADQASRQNIPKEKYKSMFEQQPIASNNTTPVRAIYNPADRIKRPPAVYDNKKSLYGINYDDL